jgi:hypothetical protein
VSVFVPLLWLVELVEELEPVLVLSPVLQVAQFV